MGGEGYIPYSVLRQYASDNGIEGEDFATFRRFMSAIDDEWLKHAAKKVSQETVT